MADQRGEHASCLQFMERELTEKSSLDDYCLVALSEGRVGLDADLPFEGTVEGLALTTPLGWGGWGAGTSPLLSSRARVSVVGPMQPNTPLVGIVFPNGQSPYKSLPTSEQCNPVARVHISPPPRQGNVS